MKKKNDFLGNFEIKYRAPYRKALRPIEGPNEIINMDEMECVQIEVRGAGKGLLQGKEVEYMDIRVYVKDKEPTK